MATERNSMRFFVNLLSAVISKNIDQICLPDGQQVRYVATTVVSPQGYTINSLTHPGFLASPNYPDKYYWNAQCQWKLKAQVHQTIRITVVDFELDVRRDGVCHDTVEVIDDTTGDVMFSDCGSLGKLSVDVASNRATVRFKTGNSGQTQRGFLLQYEALGAGCVEWPTSSHTRTVYGIANDGVLEANTTCERGYRLVLAPSDVSITSQHNRCLRLESERRWVWDTSSAPKCTASAGTSTMAPVLSLPPPSGAGRVTWPSSPARSSNSNFVSSTSSSALSASAAASATAGGISKLQHQQQLPVVDEFMHSTGLATSRRTQLLLPVYIIGIGLGVVCAMLLLSSALLIAVACYKRRRSQQTASSRQNYRMIINGRRRQQDMLTSSVFSSRTDTCQMCSNRLSATTTTADYSKFDDATTTCSFCSSAADCNSQSVTFDRFAEPTNRGPGLPGNSRDSLALASFTHKWITSSTAAAPETHLHCIDPTRLSISPTSSSAACECSKNAIYREMICGGGACFDIVTRSCVDDSRLLMSPSFVGGGHSGHQKTIFARSAPDLLQVSQLD